jgi:fibrillarin-like pre-rRNA processing protein
MRDLTQLAEKRTNIVPILADARKPETYSWIEPIDIIYQDVATNDQSEILIRNCREFLIPRGFALLTIKARSIDVTKPPKQIFKQEQTKLKRHFKILDMVELDPYEKDHAFFVMQKTS